MGGKNVNVNNKMAKNYVPINKHFKCKKLCTLWLEVQKGSGWGCGGAEKEDSKKTMGGFKAIT